MNTINNPLILKWSSEYKVNKPEDQSGEYVDKVLAEEMSIALEAIIARLNGIYNRPCSIKIRVFIYRSGKRYTFDRQRGIKVK